jgi:hypothetical protein
MPLNFREGMRRQGIVLGVLGSVAGGIGGYFLAVHARSAATRLLGESVLVDYAVASSLPVVGFLVLWGAFTCSFGFGRGFQSSPMGAGKAKRPASARKKPSQ